MVIDFIKNFELMKFIMLLAIAWEGLSDKFSEKIKK